MSGLVRSLASRWENSNGHTWGTSTVNRRLLEDTLKLDVASFTVDKITEETSTVVAVRVLLTDEKTINLIVKTVNWSTQRTKMLNVKEMFRKESLMYTSLVPKLGEDFFPSCYHATGDLIVLENLLNRGYRHPKRGSRLDAAHCKLVLSQLGRLHAKAHHLYLSSSPSISPVSVEVLYTPERIKYFSQLAEDTISIIRRTPSTSKYSSKVEKILKNTYDHLLKCLNFKGKLQTLTHGEVYAKNLMFLYSRDEPKDVKILDLQTCRVGSALLDVVQFLYMSTAAETRDAHMDDLFRTYHWSLTRSLRQVGSDTVVSFMDLRREIDSLAIFGFLSVHFQPHDHLFPKTITDVVLDLAERGVF